MSDKRALSKKKQFRLLFSLWSCVLLVGLFAPLPTLAQYDDSNDPFADFSEFDQQSEEEEDINFFRNGRFLTLGMFLGYRGFTAEYGNYYSGSPLYGLFLNYFFSLHFALEFAYLTGDHPFYVDLPAPASHTGTTNVSDLGINVKYFFNTDNVTKGLADLNPYLKVGFSQITRVQAFANEDGIAHPDEAQGINFGAGLEIPMMKNKMFFGLQFSYQVITFPEENIEITYVNSNNASVGSGIVPSGDPYTVLGIIGVNF